jgi:phosphohistidine phosphatase SixA
VCPESIHSQQHWEARNVKTRADIDRLLLQHGNKVAEELANRAISDRNLVNPLVDAVSSTKKRVKNAAAKILNCLSKSCPEAIYSKLPTFVNLMAVSDTILRWNAIVIVGNVSAVDTADRLDDDVVDVLIDLLADESMITAGHAILALGKLARNKPKFHGRVLTALLAVDCVSREPECVAILSGKVIDAFQEMDDVILENGPVVEFAQRQIKSQRRATRKRAERLLKRLT